MEKHVKPFGKMYYFGLTSFRIFPQVYDYLRPPAPKPYFLEEYEYYFVNPQVDFYSKLGDIALPIVAVYVQQRWNYDKLTQILEQL